MIAAVYIFHQNTLSWNQLSIPSLRICSNFGIYYSQ